MPFRFEKIQTLGMTGSVFIRPRDIRFIPGKYIHLKIEILVNDKVDRDFEDYFRITDSRSFRLPSAWGLNGGERIKITATLMEEAHEIKVAKDSCDSRYGDRGWKEGRKRHRTLKNNEKIR